MFFNNISTFISHFPHENLDEIIYYTEVKELLGYWSGHAKFSRF